MSREPQPSDPRFYERSYALDRLIMLSDGVFAIAMTLMAFDVRPDGAWPHTLAGMLDAVAGPFQLFFWSFFGVGIFWTTHRRLVGRLTRSDATVTGINLILLGQITLVPVATRMLSEMKFVPEVVWLYLGLFGLLGLTNTALWVYAWAARIMSEPRPGWRVVVVTAVALLVMPVGMTALGVFSVRPGLHGLPALMPVLFGSISVLRALAERADGRSGKKKAGTLPLDRAQDKSLEPVT
jgi:uncharacterized membrane protein